MIYEYLNECPYFTKRNCPYQLLLEKLCLFPQFSTVEEIETICKSQCCTTEILCSDDAVEVLTRIRQSEPFSLSDDP